jgi:hypothetical protein
MKIWICLAKSRRRRRRGSSIHRLIRLRTRQLRHQSSALRAGQGSAMVVGDHLDRVLWPPGRGYGRSRRPALACADVAFG